MIAILRITWSLTTSENHPREVIENRGDTWTLRRSLIAAECLGALFRRQSADFITTTSGFEFSIHKVSTRQKADKRSARSARLQRQNRCHDPGRGAADAITAQANPTTPIDPMTNALCFMTPQC